MLLEGQSLSNGRYQLLRLLRQGNSSEVYFAEETQVKQRVAIKVVLPRRPLDPKEQGKMEVPGLSVQKVEAIAKFHHPHILPLLGYGDEILNGIRHVYLVMPFCAEGSLADWLRKRNALLSRQDVANFMLQVSSALQYAHYNNIMHEDIKLSNLLIRERQDRTHLPEILLTDFRVVKFFTGPSSTGRVTDGAPTYMAPERWNGRPVFATDQYALAAMSFELLTGSPPFLGSLDELKQQHLNVQPQPPSALNPQLSKDIDKVILTALAKKPEDRFKSVMTFARTFDESVKRLGEKNKQLGRSIYKTIRISHMEALTGIEPVLSLSDGSTVVVPVPANAYSGQMITLPGKGEPSSEGGPPGDLIITIVVANTSPLVSSNANSSQASSSRRSSSQLIKNDQTKANILLYCVLTGIIGCIAGVILNTNHVLPPLVANIGSGVGIAIAFIAGSWAVLEKLLPKDLWSNAKKLPVILLSLITIAILTTAALLTSQYNYSIADPYIHQGPLAFNDPLVDNSKNLGWSLGTTSRDSCQFIAGGYQATSNQLHHDNICDATATNFANFVFEVEMTLVQGDCGGVAFRDNPDETQLYYFHICLNQGYTLYITTHTSNETLKTLATGVDPAIIQGPKQPNLMAVVALNGNITVYANHHSLASVVDTTFSSGQIGVVAEDNGDPTTVIFRNAKLWTL
jgi:eukaryotic-like serine/threonine-protein kinase